MALGSIGFSGTVTVVGTKIEITSRSAEINPSHKTLDTIDFMLSLVA
jgi:hypothetical protein